MILKTPLEIFKDELGTRVIDADKCSLAYLGKGELEYRDMDFMAALIRRANLFDELVKRLDGVFNSDDTGDYMDRNDPAIAELLQRAKEANE